jgi:hypothetical protein
MSSPRHGQPWRDVIQMPGDESDIEIESPRDDEENEKGPRRDPQSAKAARELVRQPLGHS